MLSSLPIILAVEFKEATLPNLYFQRDRAQALANQLSFELAKQLKSLFGWPPAMTAASLARTSQQAPPTPPPK